MKSLLAAICFTVALAIAGAGAVPAPVHAAPAAKPWTAADEKELQDLATRYVLPLIDSVNTAVNLLMTDQPKACATAKTAKAQAEAADRAVKALNARIKAEGKDMSRLNQVNEKMAEMNARVPDMVDGICNAETMKAGDPEQQAELNKVMGFVQQYTGAMNEAAKALADRDTPRACAKLAEGKAALNGLDLYLGELKAKYRADPASVAEIDKMSAEVRQWRSRLDQQMVGCPV